MKMKDTIFNRLTVATDGEIELIWKDLRIGWFREERKAPSGDRQADVDYLSRRYRSAAGNTLLKPFRLGKKRAHKLPYKRILIDVADKLKPGWKWTAYKLKDSASQKEIEDCIVKFATARVNAKLSKIKEKLDKLEPKKREEAAKKMEEKLTRLGIPSLAATQVSSVILGGALGAAVASPVAVAVFYSGFFSGIWAAVFGASSTALAQAASGVGLITAAPFIIVSISGPAYRKTIPATLRLIGIRKRIEDEAALEE